MKQHRTGTPRALAALALAAGLAGCDGVFDVSNPNNVLQEDLEKPVSAAALVHGTAARLALGDADLQRSLALLSDETIWIGSLNDRGDLDFGNFNPRSNDISDHFNDVAESRWMADEALELLTAFEAEGTLPSRRLLARAYVNAGMVYTRIGELFDDFVFSDRGEAAPPIGKAQIPAQFETAIDHYDAAYAIATELGDVALQREVLALRARTKHAQGLRAKLSGAADPLVYDAGAVADAEAFFATAPAANWVFQWVFDASTGSNSFGNDVNQRLEQRFSNDYVVPDASGRRVASVKLPDPITGEVDPRLQETITRFVAAGNYPTLVIVSAREMHLILAEAALAQGDLAGFTARINTLRAQDGLPAYAGQIPAVEMLRHERRVNLFGQMRRFLDMYRFDVVDARWVPAADARTKPGTLFPIGFTEQISNCYIVGTC